MGRRWAMFAITLFAVTMFAAAGCTSSHLASSSAPASAAGAAPAALAVVIGPNAPPPSAQATLRDAVAALLSAEQRGDHAASFVFLSDEARSTYRDVFRWKSRRDEMPVVTAFKVVGTATSAGSIDVIVDHPAGLDPFRGLSPAQDHEIWIGRQEHGGWLLDADPSATPIQPSDQGVAPAVMAWVNAAVACDQAALRREQAVDPLLGIGDAGRQLCHKAFAFSASAPSTVPPGTMTEQLVAQYSSDALGWARMVTLTGAPAPIEVLTAPIGDSWQVIGAFG
jgi:hypothetical protein